MSTDPIRLCIVTPHHPSGSSGGAEFQIECLLRELIPSRRYDISYVARSVDPEFKPVGYRIVRIGRRSRQPRFGYGMDAVPLYRALQNLRPHVIYQRVGCGYSGICTYYARRSGARMIWHVAHDSDASGKALDTGRNPLRPMIEAASIRYTIRNVTHIVTQTDVQRRLLEENYQREADGVVPNFHPEPQEVIDKSGPPTVLWVANFKPWKRPEQFVELAARLQDLSAARFVMVGAQADAGANRDWNAQLQARLRAQANIEYLGPLPQAEVNRLLARAHLFVNTSVAEGFPNTFIQAWMRAVPVVSLGVDPDAVLARESIGVSVESPAALAEAVRRFIQDPNLRQSYGERARSYALARHSVRNAGMLMSLIDTGRLGLPAGGHA